MRVLLISENRCRENLIPYPLGVSFVAAAAVAAGHEVRGLDLMLSDDPVAEVRDAVRRFEPDCVGLAVRNIDNQDMYRTEFYLDEVREVSRAVRSETDAPVVAGGAGFTIFPHECLEYLDLEVGVVGEGESTFVRLLERLEAGSGCDGLPGTAVRSGGRAVVNPPVSQEIKLLPMPDRKVIDAGAYNWTPGAAGPPLTANIQSGRGCHLKCVYCSSPLVEGRQVRKRRPGQVALELEALGQEHGVGMAWFVDSLFNFPEGYALELCREMRSRRPGVQWIATYNPMYGSEVLLEEMRKAGCFMLSVGNESGSEDMLSALRKGFSRRDITDSVKTAKSLGFKVNCFLMLGGPGETWATVEESVVFMEELEPDIVSVTVGVRVYPGCELHDMAVAEGVVAPEQGLLQPAFYIARELEPWLRGYMEEVCATHDGWVI